jgi:hypothetical protein
MNKKRTAGIVTAVIMTSLAALVVARQTGFRIQPQTAADVTPQTTIFSALEAARAGDARAYLDQYAGPMEASLKQMIAEKTETGFSAYLRTLSAEIKGLAVSEPEPVLNRRVSVRVEYVYQDRNEAQTMLLEKTGNRWKITRVEGAERVKTLVPYGTPVE